MSVDNESAKLGLPIDAGTKKKFKRLLAQEEGRRQNVRPIYIFGVDTELCAPYTMRMRPGDRLLSHESPYLVSTRNRAILCHPGRPLQPRTLEHHSHQDSRQRTGTTHDATWAKVNCIGGIFRGIHSPDQIVGLDGDLVRQVASDGCLRA
jgi:hypothetical protein